MKTSTIHSNRKKGWPASLVLALLVLAALVLTGCPQPSGGGGTGGVNAGGGSSATPTTPPLKVTNLSAVYDAESKTVTVEWDTPAGTTAHKYQVTLRGTKKETYSSSVTFDKIEATEQEETVTVVGVATDDTKGEAATTKVKLTAELAVAAIELRADVLAPETNYNVTVTFTNGGKIQEGDTMLLQLYKGEIKEGEPVDLTKYPGNEEYSAYPSAPAAEGEYTLKVLRNGTVVPGNTATITVQEPKIESITLNKTEVRPGFTINGELKGNEALASLTNLQGTVTAADGGEVGQTIYIYDLQFSYTVPADTADGTYTITVSQQIWSGETQSSTELGTVDFTVSKDVALPDMSNPFTDRHKYSFSNYGSTTSWEVRGQYLVTSTSKEENWYTFSHDDANKRITLTPYKLYERESGKTLTKDEYEVELRNSPYYSQDAMKSMFQEMIATPEEKADVIDEIKGAEPSITGLESMSDDQLYDTYIRVMLKSMGYNSWDAYVTDKISQELKVFDIKTTYSYVADGSTGSLKATEWWAPDATFKTLYDAGTNFNFSWYDSSGSSGVTSVSVRKSSVSIRENGNSQDYQITGISGSTINLEASGGGTATMTFGTITDKEPAYEGDSPQKQMTVTYNGQDYPLTHSLTEYNFTIQ